LPVILLELDASTFEVKKAYIYANSQIIAQYDGDWRTPLDCKNFYLHDRLGSVRQVMDCQAGVVALYTYNPFGETIEEYGSFDNSFKFTGQWYDDEIGWYYLRARMYDPHLGRFTSRDPANGCFKEPLTLHKYLYCSNNVINLTDPSGKAAANFIANTIYGMQYYYSMLAMMLENADSWWEVLDASITANKWRENWFDSKNLSTNPTGLAWMADPALRAFDFTVSAVEKGIEEVLNACDYGKLGKCLSAKIGTQLGLKGSIHAVGLSLCALCFGDLVIPDPVPLLDEGILCGGCSFYSIYLSVSGNPDNCGN